MIFEAKPLAACQAVLDNERKYLEARPHYLLICYMYTCQLGMTITLFSTSDAGMCGGSASC